MSESDAMKRIHRAWKAKQSEGWTQQRLGEAMGYPPASARQSVSQFLRSTDPRASMLERFAAALSIPLAEILADQQPAAPPTAPPKPTPKPDHKI